MESDLIIISTVTEWPTVLSLPPFPALSSLVFRGPLLLHLMVGIALPLPFYNVSVTNIENPHDSVFKNL